MFKPGPKLILGLSLSFYIKSRLRLIHSLSHGICGILPVKKLCRQVSMPDIKSVGKIPTLPEFVSATFHLSSWANFQPLMSAKFSVLIATPSSVNESAESIFYQLNDFKFCRHCAEIHFVHINRKYKTPGEAMKHPDGLAVLAFFINVLDGNGQSDAFKVSHKCE